MKILITGPIDETASREIVNRLSELRRGRNKEIELLISEVEECRSLDECARLAELINEIAQEVNITATLSGTVCSGAVLIAAACSQVKADALAIVGGLEIGGDRDASDVLVELVARYRGLNFENTLAAFEAGQLLLAPDARRAGLVDLIQ